MTTQSEMPLMVLGATRLIPLLTIERVEDAAPLAAALVEAGLATLEVALRTPAAPRAIAEIRKHVPAATVIAGNVLTPHDLSLAVHAGVSMAVSPASSPALLEAAVRGDMPFMPGIATPSELLAAIRAGFNVVKFFPAIAFGGPEALRAMHAPFPHARFVPTGGTSDAELDKWFALPNVVAVGGAWLAPVEEIRAHEWNKIAERGARAKARLKA